MQSKMVRNGYSEDYKCTLCGFPDTEKHYMVCSNRGIDERRQKIIGNLWLEMRKYGLLPVIISWILTEVRVGTPDLEEVDPLRMN